MQRVFRYLLPLLFAMIVGVGDLQAQSAAGNATNFPVPFGPTNAGRDFWLAFPANWDLPGSTSYYIRLYITAGVRTQVRVWVGAGVKTVTFTKPNDIITIDLTPTEAQMFVRADQPPVPPDRIFRKKAVHISADAPVVVYAMNRTTYTSDGILALPTNALGRDYIVASYAAVIGVSQELPSQYMIVAPYNGTTVSIYHPHRTPTHAAGESFTIDLDSGDVFTAMTVGYGGDMSGATIRASKPVAVVAGQNCTYIPNLLNFCCCDHLTEMMLPTASWGKFYQGVPFQTRLKGDFWRIFAKEPNTKVYINGAEYATLNEVGGEEGTGWFEFRALGKDVQEFHADKPIYVAQYNPSQYYDGVPSDPFYLVLTPLEQYQTALTFCTPAADFPQNFVNLVCDEQGYYEIEITVAGKEDWQPLWKMGGVGVPKKFPTKINGKTYLGVTIEIKPGVYRVRGKSPFAGYIYGFSSFDSYGYPLSVATGDLTKPDKDAPTVTKDQDCNGTVQVITRDMPIDDNIRTNLATIELDSDPASTENYELFVTPFEAGVSQTTTYTLKVTDRSKPAKAVMIISDMAGNVTLDTVTYNPLDVTMLPSPQDFEKVRVGDTRQKTITLTNNSDNPLDLKQILLKSGKENFRILSPTGKVVVPAKGTVEVVIEFTASLNGKTSGLVVYEDSVGIEYDCGLKYMALVKGQVVKPMIEVTDHDYGKVPVGVETGTWQMDVRNVSPIEGSTLTVSGKTGPANSSVMIFDVKGGTANPTFTLEPGQTRTLQITAKPADVIKYFDTVFFASDAMDVDAGDDYGWLQVEGIRGEVYATDFDWSRRRQSYVYGPETVFVRNIGTAGVKINGLGIQNGPDADQFAILNEPAVRGKLLGPGEEVAVQVEFRPTSTGQKEAKIVYEMDPPQQNEVSSKLTGFGTLPELYTTNYSFGSMLVDAPEMQYAGTDAPIAFWTPSKVEFDSVTITGFQFTSDNVAGKGDDFRWQAISLPTPVVLKAGERYTLDGWFQAHMAGTRRASIRAITNDNIPGVKVVDTTSYWTGIGTSQDAQIQLTATTLPLLCSGTTGDIVVTITNPGQADLTIDRLAVDGGPFQIIDPADPNADITIPSQGSVSVTIRYTATDGTQTANLLVYNNAVNATNGVSAQAISGRGVNLTWNTKLVLSGTKPPKAELGKELVAELWLDNTFTGIPTGMTMTSYTVTLQYDPKLLTPRAGVKGAGTGGPGTVVVKSHNKQTGTMVLEVSGYMDSKNDALLRVPFAVLFDANLTRSVEVTSITTDAAPACVTVNGSVGTIEVEPICGLNLRMIELMPGTYTLDQNKPNPFNPVTKIQYSLGLDGQTQLNLYDANGKLVQVLVNEYQQPGRYELTLDVTNLSSGNYYYTIVSGDWKETKMLTVVK